MDLPGGEWTPTVPPDTPSPGTFEGRICLMGSHMHNDPFFMGPWLAATLASDGLHSQSLWLKSNKTNLKKNKNINVCIANLLMKPCIANIAVVLCFVTTCFTSTPQIGNAYLYQQIGNAANFIIII